MSPFRRALLGFILSAFFLSFSTKAMSQSVWQKEWARSLELAKKEGEVQIYGPHNPMYLPIWALFQKAFPEVKIKFIPGKGSQHAERISAERRAGKYLVDIVMGGATTYVSYPEGAFQPIRPLLILPEVTDPSAWWGKKLSFSDPDERFVLMVTAWFGGNRVAYNTNQVNPKELESWWDLLKPKWKGKIAAFDPHSTGGGETIILFFYHNPDLGPKLISRLFSEMNILLTRDVRQGTDWLGTGKTHLYLGSTGSILRAKEQGLPVDVPSHPMKEGEVMGGSVCCLAVAERAPHPNATKVFINWVLSREGQIAWQKHTEINSLRTDIPKDELPKESLPLEGVRYLHMSLAKYNNAESLKAMRKIVDEAMKKTGK